MKSFRVNFSSDEVFKITEDDKIWVEENFRWLKEVFGYPNKLEDQVVVTAQFFPATFSAPFVEIKNVVDDLCRLLGVSKNAVRIEVRPELHSGHNIASEQDREKFECDAELMKGRHVIVVAQTLLKSPERLIYTVIYQFIRIRLAESEIEFDAGGDDNELFIYLAGIYYGFGIPLSEMLERPDNLDDHLREIKWNRAQMPLSVMAYSLAVYAHLRGEVNPSWKKGLPVYIIRTFESALQYLQQNPADLYDPSEVMANELFNLSNEQFEKHQLDDAIATLQKILFLTNDPHMKADVYNNMGYYFLRKKDYGQGISSFRKALSFGPDYGFANDNLGYALIMNGDAGEGLKYIKKALETQNNDPAYTYRNFALYYQNEKSMGEAKYFFELAFAQQTPVDLLEFHYAEFLNELGDGETARAYYRKSAEKGEQEGIEKLSSYND